MSNLKKSNDDGYEDVTAVSEAVAAEAEPKPSKYRWAILALTWITAISIFSSINQLSPISSMIIEGLGISNAQYGLLYSSPMLGVACMAIISGAASDRFGPRIVVSVGITILAIFAFSRGFAANMGSYPLMLTCNFLMGAGFGITYPNLPKLVSDWFPERQRGLATSIYSTGIPCGSSSALILTVPVFLVLAKGDWANVPFCWGVIPITVAVLMWALCRNSPTFVSSKDKSTSSNSEKAPLFNKEIYKNKTLWRIGLTFFCTTWIFYCCLSWFPRILAARGVETGVAGAITGLIPLFGLLGNLIVPVLSDKIHWRSIFVMGGQSIGATCFLLMLVAPVQAYSIMLPLIGFCDNAAYACLAFLLPLDLMPKEQRGSAVGLIMTLGYISGLIGPLFVGALWDVTQSINAVIISLAAVYLIGLSIARHIPDPVRLRYLESRKQQRDA